MATTSAPKFLTTGDISRTLNASPEQVKHIILRDRVDPIGIAGRVRLFGEDALERVRAGLDRSNRHNPEAPAAQ